MPGDWLESRGEQHITGIIFAFVGLFVRLQLSGLLRELLCVLLCELRVELLRLPARVVCGYRKLIHKTRKKLCHCETAPAVVATQVNLCPVGTTDFFLNKFDEDLDAHASLSMTQPFERLCIPPTPLCGPLPRWGRIPPTVRCTTPPMGENRRGIKFSPSGGGDRGAVMGVVLVEFFTVDRRTYIPLYYALRH